MNTMQSLSLNNVAICMSFSHPLEKKFKVVSFSCKATVNDFHKDLSTLDSKNASLDQIKKTYRKMALRYHPDVCDPSLREESTTMFIKLKNTYENLLNQDSREMNGSDASRNSRSKWENQLSGLKRRSRKEGSWGSKMRANYQCP